MVVYAHKSGKPHIYPQHPQSFPQEGDKQSAVFRIFPQVYPMYTGMHCGIKYDAYGLQIYIAHLHKNSKMGRRSVLHGAKNANVGKKRRKS